MATDDENEPPVPKMIFQTTGCGRVIGPSWNYLSKYLSHKILDSLQKQ